MKDDARRFIAYSMKTFLKIVIILCTLEIILQMVAYVNYYYSQHQLISRNTFLTNWYLNDPRNAWWQKEAASITPIYHPFFTYIFRNIDTPYFHYDNSGARFTLYNPPQDGQKYKKIFFFGGSSMAGYAVKDEETIPSYVARKLNTPTYRYSVTNFGQIGYNSNQELLLFISQLKNGNVPDIVVFYDGVNDIIDAKNSGKDSLNDIPLQTEYTEKMGSLFSLFHLEFDNPSLINIKKLKTMARFIVTNVKLIYYPMQVGRSIIEHMHPDYLSKQQRGISLLSINIQRMIENYENNAKLIDALSRQYHFDYMLIWQPLAENKKLTPEEKTIDTEPSLDPLSATASAMFRQRSINHFFDFSNVFDHYGQLSLFFDPIHVIPEGNDIIASAITDHIKTITYEY